MNIVLISTYNDLCGIASYTKHLKEALEANNHRTLILAEATSKSLIPYKEDFAYKIWKRTAAYNSEFGLNSVLEHIKKINKTAAKPDVVHIQHEFGLFPNNIEFLCFINELSQFVKVIVTFHTVTKPPENVGFFPVNCESIVHTQEAWIFASPSPESLNNYSCHVVPHGVYSPLNVKSKFLGKIGKIWLIPGFISPSKGHIEIIDAFANSHIVYSNDKLIIAGLCRYPLYLNSLESKINSYGLKEKIEIHEGFKSDEEMDSYFKGSDFVILGGDKTSPYSASGQLADAVGANIPIIAKDIPIYRSQYSPYIMRYRNVKDLTLFFNKLSFHDKLYIPKHSNYLNWDEVAKEHVKIYGKI